MIPALKRLRSVIPLTLLATAAFIAATITPSQRHGHFSIAHRSPVFQDITRMAFLHQSRQDLSSLHFSTLESYHRNPNGDRALLVAHKPASSRTSTASISGSIEIRCYAYSKAISRYVLGASLDPQIFLYDPENHGVKLIFSGRPSDGFVHSLAVGTEHVYTILSHATKNRGDGILKINMHTGRRTTLPFTDTSPQGWGGVQAVDPTSRIWFYRAYPLQMMWHDAQNGMRPRSIPGFEGWSVESWDAWGGHTYLLLTNSKGEFIKHRIDLISLKSPKEAKPPESSNMRLFMESIRLDLYNTESPALGNLYFHPGSSTFYKRDSPKDNFTFLGSFDLGIFQVMGFSQTPQESPTRWQHPTLGEIEVLGISADNELIIWLRGRKIYATGDFKNHTLTLKEVSAPSLSPADITSLAIGADGFLYGGGIMTMSHIFRIDPATSEAQLLKGAIPNAEGQINALWAGWDGKLYGAGYPNSVLFRFDTSAPWNPGMTPGSNPLNLGPMGHFNQTRASKGVQDLDGAVWYESVTDYSIPIAHALAKADFNKRTLVVKTDLADGFPQVKDLAVLDREHLLLLGQSKGRPALFVLNQREFRIENMRELSQAGGVLVNLAPPKGTTRLFLAQGKTLFRVQRDLALEPIHKSEGVILRILAGTANDVILIGERHIEKITPTSGQTALWWDGRPWHQGRGTRSKPGGRVFRHASWTPAVFRNGVLHVADEEKIWSFYPPVAN